MFWTGRVEYDGRIIIVIGVNISRLLWGVYVIFPLSVSDTIIIVAIFIIFSRDIVLVSIVIVWFGVGDFILKSIEDFQSDGGLSHEPPYQLANTSGER